MNPHPKIAFIHDWLVEFGGAEQVLAALLEVWPDAPIYTLVHDPDGPCGLLVRGRHVETSFIQRLPGAPRKYRRYLALMPLAIEQFDLRAYDVIVSISYAVAHGIIPGPEQLHINYICSPVRYAWHLYHEYLESARLTRGPASWVARLVLHYLRLWDALSAQRVDEFVAISQWVARHVWRNYHRPAVVIYPPVDVDRFTLRTQKEGFYLTISRLVPYKRIDLMLEAFRQMADKKLVVIGDGPELPRLKANAPANVEFLGFQPFDSLKDCLARARALIFAAEEDFGIVPVEAQACGTPVIAYRKGGALETVIDGKTGLFFDEQTPESLIEAIQHFESDELYFSPDDLRRNAERFSKSHFQEEFSRYIMNKWAQSELRMPE